MVSNCSRAGDATLLRRRADVQDLVLSLGDPSLGEDEHHILPSTPEAPPGHVVSSRLSSAAASD